MVVRAVRAPLQPPPPRQGGRATCARWRTDRTLSRALHVAPHADLHGLHKPTQRSCHTPSLTQSIARTLACPRRRRHEAPPRRLLWLERCLQCLSNQYQIRSRDQGRQRARPHISSEHACRLIMHAQIMFIAYESRKMHCVLRGANADSRSSNGSRHISHRQP